MKGRGGVLPVFRAASRTGTDRDVGRGGQQGRRGRGRDGDQGQAEEAGTAGVSISRKGIAREGEGGSNIVRGDGGEMELVLQILSSNGGGGRGKGRTWGRGMREGGGRERTGRG
jgi:hypothetical protein